MRPLSGVSVNFATKAVQGIHDGARLMKYTERFLTSRPALVSGRCSPLRARDACCLVASYGYGGTGTGTPCVA